MRCAVSSALSLSLVRLARQTKVRQADHGIAVLVRAIDKRCPSDVADHQGQLCRKLAAPKRGHQRNGVRAPT